MNKIILITALFILAGCASANYSWEHPDSDYRSVNYDKDVTVCKEEALNASMDEQSTYVEEMDTIMSTVGTIFMSRRKILGGLEITRIEHQTFKSCMTEKGWQKVKH